MIKTLKALLIVISIIYIPATMHAQNWQTSVSVDTRVGYSSNTYLNPFFSVWDPAVQSGYGVVSIFGQGFWSKNNNALEITGGLVAEPFFNNQSIWRGGLGLVDYRRKLTTSFNAGIEAGGSYFTGFHSAGTAWAQPYIRWFASPFTSLRLKAGTYFQSYQNFADTTDFSRRSEVFGLEFETWPGYHWQLKASVFGKLNKITAPQEQLRSALSVGYLFLNGSKITVLLGFEQYQFQFTTTGFDGGGPGNPPVGGPPAQTETSQGNDQIWRLGLTGRYPINRSISIFTSIEGLRRTISTTTEQTSDFKVSGGIRFSFQPKVGSPKRGVITPEWQQKDDQTVTVTVHYSGGGRLYLVGDFNNWKREGIPLTEQPKNSYTAQVSVSVGAYEYKILHVEGATEEWLPFSNNTYTVDDGFGGENAMFLVE
jgi:hypothetical protein